jgi:hypothetical protein
MDLGSHQQNAKELREAWDKAIDRMLAINRDLGMSVLKNEVWPRLELLGCVGPEENVNDYLNHSEMLVSLKQFQKKHEKSNNVRKGKKYK